MQQRIQKIVDNSTKLHQNRFPYEIDRVNEVYRNFVECYPIITEALSVLEKELPKNLFYHGPDHTHEVLHEAIRLAINEVTERQLELVAIAAAYHDIGYIETNKTNEPIGAKKAREAMERYGYEESEIRQVEKAILDTQLKYNANKGTLVQECSGGISKYLLDADLSNFGRPDFFKRSLILWREFTGQIITSPTQCRERNVLHYITDTALLMYHHKWLCAVEKQPQQHENIGKLLKLISKITGTDEELETAWRELVGE